MRHDYDSGAGQGVMALHLALAHLLKQLVPGGEIVLGHGPRGACGDGVLDLRRLIGSRIPPYDVLVT